MADTDIDKKITAALDALRAHREGPNRNADLAKLAVLFFPNDSIPWAMGYMMNGKKSLCGIAGQTIPRALGCTCKEINRPYEKNDGTAVFALEIVARRHKAWRTQIQARGFFEEGEIVTIDPGNPHVLCVRECVAGPSEGVKIVGSTDSGQGGYRIKDRVRLYNAASKLFVDTDDGVSTRVGFKRALWGSLDPRLLAASVARGECV